MHRYKMIGEGTHYHHGRALRAGDTVDCEVDLTQVFPNIFQDLGEVTVETLPAMISRSSPANVRTPANAESSALTSGSSSESEEDEEEEVPEGWEEVTSEFEEAEPAGLRVFKVGPLKYSVIDPALGFDRPLNKKPVAKSQVSRYI